MADYKFFRPKPGRFGVAPAWMNTSFGAITASATTTKYMGATPRQSYIEQVAVSALTPPVSAGGTVLITFYKWDASASAAVTLTTAYNLESLTAKVGHVIPILSTLSVTQRTFDEGDTLYASVVSDASIGTAEVDVVLSADFAVLR